MKSLRRITVVLASLCLFIVLLLTSFEVAIYGDNEYKFYQKEYEKYQVQEKLDMEMDDIMYVTEEMMSYLHGEREELSVMVKVEGKQQDFFNDQDRFHMGEVKVLFLGGLKASKHSGMFCCHSFCSGIVFETKKRGNVQNHTGHTCRDCVCIGRDRHFVRGKL